MPAALIIWIPYIFQSNNENDSNPTQEETETLNAYMEVKESVEEFRDQIIKVKDIFEKQFLPTIESYITPPIKKFYFKTHEYGGIETQGNAGTISARVLDNTERYYSLSHSKSEKVIDYSTVYPSQDVYIHEPSGNTPIEATLRKIFFSDLYLFCHKYFSDIRKRFISETTFEQKNPLYPDNLNKLCKNLIKLDDYTKKMNLDFSYLKEKEYDYSFLYFMNRLENFISEKTVLTIGNIREALYNIPDLPKEAQAGDGILVIWDAFNILVENYTPQNSSSEEEEEEKKHLSELKKKIKNQTFENTGILKALKDNLMCYLDIDIIREYRSSINRHEDYRFMQNGYNIDVFTSCENCSKKSLLTVSCNIHSKEIAKLRKAFSRGISNEFSAKTSSYSWLVTELIETTQEFAKSPSLNSTTQILN
ncbi:hypothetical protein CDIK_1932 [Cucumispora dikerogammari]|nr:hypothetical protein CDIK_1932 [Cucumispora dikerogammari]